MDTKDMRSILGYEEMLPKYNIRSLHLTPDQTKLLSSSSSLSTTNTHTPHRHIWDRVASMFTAYRLLDTFAAHPEQWSQAPLPSIVLNKVMQKTLTQEMANGLKIFDKLRDWPNVLRTARRAVENSISNPKKNLLGRSTNKIWTLLGSVARRNTKPMFDKVSDNFQMAALHYTVMTEMRGIENDGNILPDLPDDLNTLVSTYGQEDVESLARITEFLSLTTASHLRIPLQVALMVSPILLLINYQLHKTRCDRTSLLKIHKALGNARPPALQEIEIEIFQTLLRVSQNMDIMDELAKLVNSAKWRQCEALPATDPACDFFRPLGSNDGGMQPRLSEPESEVPLPHDTVSLARASFRLDGNDLRIMDNDVEIGLSPRFNVLVDENADKTKLGMAMAYDSMDYQCDSASTLCHEVDNTETIHQSEENVSSLEETRNQNGAGHLHGEELYRDISVREGVGTTDNQSNSKITSEVDAGGASSCIEMVQKSAAEGGLFEDNVQETHIMEATSSSTDMPPISKDLCFGGIFIGSGLKDVVVQPGIVATPPEEKEDTMSTDEVNPDIDSEDEGMEDTTSLLTSHATLTHQAQGSKLSLSKSTTAAQRPPKKRRRQRKKQAKSRDKSNGQQPVKKKSNPEAETEHSLYIDVDLWNPMAISLNVNEEPPKMYGPEITTYNAFGENVKFRPCAHDPHTLNIIEVLWSQIKSKYVNDKPAFLSNPKDSCITIIHTEDMASYTDYDLLQILKKKHIVTIGEGNPSKTFRNALRALGSTTTVRTVQDQSIPSHDNYNERCQKGTLKQLLQASESKNGKILNALDIPLPTTGPFSSPFSSDVKALFATQGSWKTSGALSVGDVRWGLAATTGAFHTWHIDSNGFATFILPLSGSKWWILARPKSSDAPECLDINIFLDGRFDLDKACDDLWTLEAILLEPGTRLYMRPNTPHAVYTPESAVVDGGHFYPSVALADALNGIVHSFIAGDLVTNTNHGPARFHLQQLIAFFHSAFVQNLYEPDDPCLDHVPNYRTKDGYSNIVSLCIYGILINVLDFDTYRHPQQLKVHMTEGQEQEWMDWDRNVLSIEQCKACMYARGQCLQIMEWLSRQITAVHIRERQDGEMQTKTRSFAASVYQEMLLVAYCHKIYAYKQLAEQRGIQGAPTCDKRLLKVQLDGVLSGKLNRLIQKGILDKMYGQFQEDHAIARIDVRAQRVSQAHEEGGSFQCSDYTLSDIDPVDPDPNTLLRKGMSIRDVLYQRGQEIKYEQSESDLPLPSQAKKRRRSSDSL